MKTCANFAVVVCGLVIGSGQFALAEVLPSPPSDPPKAGISERPAGFFVPPPPRSTEELRAELRGLTLPDGFQDRPAPASPDGRAGGVITGPGKLEIHYTVAPTYWHELADGQVHFTSEASAIAAGEHKWTREQYIADERVQLALAMDETLAVSYPDRGINFVARVDGLSQLTDTLLVAFSISNQERSVSWAQAKKLIASGDVDSVSKSFTGLVFLNLVDGTTAKTRQPSDDAVVKLIRALGMDDKISVATD